MQLYSTKLHFKQTVNNKKRRNQRHLSDWTSRQTFCTNRRPENSQNEQNQTEKLTDTGDNEHTIISSSLSSQQKHSRICNSLSSFSSCSC